MGTNWYLPIIRRYAMITMPKEAFFSLRQQVLQKEFGRMNDMQQKAVFHTEGPLLVLAGAGSGKTTVLVNRIANIIRYGNAFESREISDSLTDADIAACKAYLSDGTALSSVTKARLSTDACPPWRVLAITFTNKAAGELKERLSAMLDGDDGNQVWASTFHASCARILRRDGEALGYTGRFTIYDTDDSNRLMKQCLNQLDISKDALTHKAALGEISRAKDSLRTPEIYEKEAGNDFRLRQVARAYKLYQQKLKEADAMDFDDLLVNTVKLFQEHPDVLDYYQRRFRYVMVDEYQDTNHVQYEFVNLLAQRSENLCVVGDDDQSIYKFRGATIENILNFEKGFQGAQVVRLEQNYRSTQSILDAANAVISNNTERKGKSLWTANGEGEKIVFHIAENEQDEANQIAKSILDGVAAGRKFSDYAILYRMNSQSMLFERMFAKQGIPHRILGGTRFYERLEIRDMIAYLTVINNPSDSVRLRRIINRPKRGIGDKTMENAEGVAEHLGITLFEAICRAKEFPVLSRAANALTQFAVMMQSLIDFYQSGAALNDLYKEILDKTGYVDFLRSDDPEKAEDRIENVYELSSNIQRYQQEGGIQTTEFYPDEAVQAEATEVNLSSFLEEVALLTDIDNYDPDADSCVLMTIHSAKGLEFPCVFLPGWEEGVFPGNAVLYNPAEAEEERRLAYVAITRAREELQIYATETRMIFGTTSRNRPSRFVQEIPEALLATSYSRTWGIPPAMPGKNRSGDTPWTGTGGQSGSFGVSAPWNKPEVPAPRGLPTPAQPQSRAEGVGGFQPTPMIKTPPGTYKAGDIVLHKAFGTGRILSATPMANDTLLEIAFDKSGKKKLFANFARLEKPGE